MRVLRHLGLIGMALACVMLAGTAGFHFIEGWSWFDGFYMVVTTLTTIGYQEIHPLSHAGRVFNVFVIGAGVSLVFLGIGATHPGFARIRTSELLRKAQNGTRYRPP